MKYIHKIESRYGSHREAFVEHRINHNDRKVLVLRGESNVVVPGYLVKEEYERTPQGLFISEIEPINSKDTSCVSDLVINHFENISKKVFQDPYKIKIGSINFW